MSSKASTLTATRTGSPGALAARLRSGAGTHGDQNRKKHSKNSRRSTRQALRSGRGEF